MKFSHVFKKSLLLSMFVLGFTACSDDDDATPTEPEVVDPTDPVDPMDPVDPILVIPEMVSYVSDQPVYPEGITYDSARESFLVSSATTGTISLVDMEGNYSVLVAPSVFNGNGTFGLAIDQANDKLYAVSTNLSNPTIANFYVFTLSTGALEHEIDLAALTPMGLNFINDVTADGNGNAYITNSDQGVIYKVDASGNASVFFNDAAYAPSDAATETGFNGIAYHSDGFLLVTHYVTDSLYKIATADASISAVAVPSGIIDGGDGLAVSGNDLVIVNNADPIASSVIKLTTIDDYDSAILSGTPFSTGVVFPTTVVEVNGEYMVNYSYFTLLFSGDATNVNYDIVKASF